MTQQACAKLRASCVYVRVCERALPKDLATVKESKQKVTLFCEQASKALRQFRQADKKIKTNPQYGWAEEKLRGSITNTEVHLAEKAPYVPPLP